MTYCLNNKKAARRGDIFYVANAKYYATDPDNTLGRPGVIVSSDLINENMDVVEVVYLTTRDKAPLPTHAPIQCKISSTALCETIFTISKERLGDYVRTCTEEEMDGIDAALAASLGLHAVNKSVDNDDGAEEDCDDYEEASYVDAQSILIERDFYKAMYEQLLDRVVPARQS